MPELAEVEFYRQRWTIGHGAKVLLIHTHPHSRIFRGEQPESIAHALSGTLFRDSEAVAKQMLFRFSGGHWLGLHLGMTGELKTAPADYQAGKHDHFTDSTRIPRLFRVCLCSYLHIHSSSLRY